jgi:Protein of unknown function (DUF3300)/Chaperone of endosialidase
MILRTIRRSLTALLLLLIPAIALAQTPSAPAPPSTAPAQASSNGLLKPEQLEALVSPIALYPDALLSTVLMASTYPLEIVEAERWLTHNKTLSGDALKAAADKQAWDDTVKALIATPPVLAMMSAELNWTQKLGDAVLAQQTDVMEAIQRLRLRAEENGKLTTTPEQKVTVEQQDNRKTVVIEQASDDTVYVPAYDPSVVYGAWPYAEYPPYYWGYPSDWGYGAIGAGLLARGLWFGAGYGLGRWGSGNWAWGGRVNWGNGNLVRNWPRATPYNVTNINNIGNNVGNNWQHNPAHRGGVRYNNANVQQRFGNANRRAGGQPGGNLGGGNLGSHLGAAAIGAGAGAALRGGQRPNAADRQAQRPNAGNRQAQRSNAGNRQGQRPNAGNRQAQRSNAANRQGQRQRTANRPAPRHTAANRPAHHARSANFGGRGGSARASVGGGGMRMGGGAGRGGGGRGGGGRRSDIALKHDIALLGHLDNGIGFYRFDYNGSNKPYVGVIAQEVQTVMPQAVRRDRDGYLRVYYDKLGLTFQTYDHWIASGARVPAGATRP